MKNGKKREATQRADRDGRRDGQTRRQKNVSSRFWLLFVFGLNEPGQSRTKTTVTLGSGSVGRLVSIRRIPRSSTVVPRWVSAALWAASSNVSEGGTGCASASKPLEDAVRTARNSGSRPPGSVTTHTTWRPNPPGTTVVVVVAASDDGVGLHAMARCKEGGERGVRK